MKVTIEITEKTAADLADRASANGARVHDAKVVNGRLVPMSLKKSDSVIL